MLCSELRWHMISCVYDCNVFINGSDGKCVACDLSSISLSFWYRCQMSGVTFHEASWFSLIPAVDYFKEEGILFLAEHSCSSYRMTASLLTRPQLCWWVWKLTVRLTVRLFLQQKPGCRVAAPTGTEAERSALAPSRASVSGEWVCRVLPVNLGERPLYNFILIFIEKCIEG